MEAGSLSSAIKELCLLWCSLYNLCFPWVIQVPVSKTSTLPLPRSGQADPSKDTGKDKDAWNNRNSGYWASITCPHAIPNGTSEEHLFLKGVRIPWVLLCNRDPDVSFPARSQSMKIQSILQNQNVNVSCCLCALTRYLTDHPRGKERKHFILVWPLPLG